MIRHDLDSPGAMNAQSLSAVAAIPPRFYRLVVDVLRTVAPNSTAIGDVTRLAVTEPAYLQFCETTAIVPWVRSDYPESLVLLDLMVELVVTTK